MSRIARVLFLCLGLALVGCAEKDAGDWVVHMLSAHESADRLLREGDTSGARALLVRAVEAKVPEGTRPRDARIVRQDLLYRLAELELRDGRAGEAAKWASRGIALGRGKDVFTANLLIVRGHALEETHDANGASRDYHEALLVTEALLDESLGDTPKAP